MTDPMTTTPPEPLPREALRTYHSRLHRCVRTDGDVVREAVYGGSVGVSCDVIAALASPSIDIETLARTLAGADHGTEYRDRVGRLIGWAFLGEQERARLVGDAERIAAEYARLRNESQPAVIELLEARSDGKFSLADDLPGSY